ncbi:MAG: hypothetical protein AVDCRST_MAG60-132 [uncultured Nocardioides sp.]|uniref:Uncharacterized protein n=1 Tax=uncultured Nocardioides sp. TaxID=198441 RepID=A0A6J4MXC3_9ACTN|nr:MAG: hypothetical protein AVDCRST_MAG60-132 [uncultured Nocardioides sp.]
MSAHARRTGGDLAYQRSTSSPATAGEKPSAVAEGVDRAG